MDTRGVGEHEKNSLCQSIGQNERGGGCYPPKKREEEVVRNQGELVGGKAVEPCEMVRKGWGRGEG